MTDLKHVFAVNPLRPGVPRAGRGPVRRPGPAAVAARSRPGSTRSGSTPATGRPAASRFHFDNEGPRHRAFVEAFELADRLVTCGEYLAFMDDGGYDAGAAVAVARLGRAPGERVDGAVLLGARATASGGSSRSPGCGRVDPHEPVTHLSYFEADAYARWAGARLPERGRVGGRRPDRLGRHRRRARLLRRRGPPPPRPGRDASAATAPRRPSLRSARCSARCGSGRTASTARTPATGPSRARSASTTASSWPTSSSCAAAAVATSRSHIRPTYRNFFPPDATWQFTGLRLARS